MYKTAGFMDSIGKLLGSGKSVAKSIHAPSAVVNPLSHVDPALLRRLEESSKNVGFYRDRVINNKKYMKGSNPGMDPADFHQSRLVASRDNIIRSMPSLKQEIANARNIRAQIAEAAGVPLNSVPLNFGKYQG